MVFFYLTYLIGLTKNVYIFVVETEYLEKHMTMYLVLSCAKEAICMRQNSILIFCINMFEKN